MTAPAGYTIRPAIESDRAAIAAFTDQTFAWGDYIVMVWEKWLADPSGLLLAAVEENTHQPVAIVHVALNPPDEAWLEGARVHPLHRRRGLADALNAEAVSWAARRGATVARLGAEATNEPAARQVSRMGYRAVGRFVYAWANPEEARSGMVRPPQGAEAEHRAEVERRAEVVRRAEGEHPEEVRRAWEDVPARTARPSFPADAGSVRLATAADAASVARIWHAYANQPARAAAGGLAGRDWAWWSFGETQLSAALREGRVLLCSEGLGVLHLDTEPAELNWLDGAAAPEIARAAVLAAWAVRAEQLLALVPATAANERALAGAGFHETVTMVIYELSLPVVA